MSNFIKQLKSITNMDDDVLDKKLELLDIDSLMSLQQAANAGNEEEVKKILAGTTKISKSDIKASAEPNDDEAPTPTTTTINKYNIGDEVLIGTEGKEDEPDEEKIEGSIKIPSAPHGTVGVLIDGELQMVDKKLVKRDTRVKTNEAFAEDDRDEAASMADSIDADPMAEPSEETPTDTVDAEAGADDMGAGDMSSYGADDYGSEEEADDAADDANDGYLDRIKQLAGMNTPAMNSSSLAAGPVQGLDQPEVTAVSSVPLSVPSVGSDAMSEILASIDAIEQKINDVRLSDFRPIYTRIESMLKNVQASGKVAVVEGEKKGLFAYLREQESKKKSLIEGHGNNGYDSLDVFTTSFVDTAVDDFSHDEDNEEYKDLGVYDVSAESIEKMKRLCHDFQSEANKIPNYHEYGDEQAGYDFYQTMVGAGVGFWENDHGPKDFKEREALCKALDELTTKLVGRVSFHGDVENGEIYFSFM